MATLRIAMDAHLIDRLTAVMLLQQEQLPDLPYGRGDAARQALNRGLDIMLRELLLGSHKPNARERRKSQAA